MNLIARARIINILIVVFYAVGIAGLTLDFSRDVFTLLVPFTLLGSAILMLLMDESGSKRLWVLLPVIYVSSFLVELAGVNTGMIFGAYEYGPTLGAKIFGTPVIIGVNWIILVYAIWALIGQSHMAGILKIVLSSAAMVVYDFVLEPIAIRLDMWTWEGGDIPVQNYMAWFGFSFLLFTMLHFAGVKIRNRVSLVLLLTQFGFFVALNFLLV